MLTNALALYSREVKRFQKIMLDTVATPLVSTLLYLLTFGIVAGNDRAIEGLPYLFFVYAGLMAMLVVNTSFSNPTFALIIAKNVGTIVDLQVAPLKPQAIGLTYAAAALTRGVITIGIALLGTLWFVPSFTIAHPIVLLFGILVTGFTFGLIGVVFGMWAKNFEALQFVMTFVLQPMIFLSGVFYPVATLPSPWKEISFANPLHHFVNLIRYGFTGYTDTSVTTSAIIGIIALLVFFALMRMVVRRRLTDIAH